MQPATGLCDLGRLHIAILHSRFRFLNVGQSSGPCHPQEDDNTLARSPHEETHQASAPPALAHGKPRPARWIERCDGFAESLSSAEELLDGTFNSRMFKAVNAQHHVALVDELLQV